MATNSSILAWRIPWTEKPGELWSMGSQKNWTRLSMHVPLPSVSPQSSPGYLRASPLEFPAAFPHLLSPGSHKCESRDFPVGPVVKTVLQGFPGGSVVKNPPASAGDTGSITDPGRSHVPWSN